MSRKESKRAWIGYKDGKLVAIELSGFHAGETVEGWERQGYRVEVVTDGEAMDRWRREVQGWRAARADDYAEPLRGMIERCEVEVPDDLVLEDRPS